MGNEIIDTAPLFGKITEMGALVTFELLVILGLCWLVRYFVTKNAEQHKTMTDAFIKNTEIVAEFKELIRGLLSQKN